MVQEEQEFQAGNMIPDFLRDPLGIPQRRWRWMVAGLVAGLIATAYLFWSWVPVYVATASITIDTGGKLPDEMIQSTVSESDWDRVSGFRADVFSNENLSKIIKELDLYPEERKTMRMGEVVGLMRGSLGLDRGWGFGDKRYAPSDTRNFSVSFAYGEPQAAAQVANRLADRFVEVGLRERSKRASVTTDFLQRELARSEKELRAHEQKLKEFNEMYRGELPSELTTNLRKLDRLQSDKQSLQLRITQAEQSLNALMSGEGDPNSPQTRLLALRVELQKTLAVYTEEHPQVASIRRQIAATEAEIAGQGGLVPEGTSPVATLAAARRRLELLRQQLVDAEAEARVIEDRVARTPSRADELAVLNRETKVLRDEYMGFLKKVQTAELSQTVEAAQYAEEISVTRRARPPGAPIEGRLRPLALGLLASLALFLGAGVAVEFFDPVLVAQDQLESIADVPVLGAVHRIA